MLPLLIHSHLLKKDVECDGFFDVTPDKWETFAQNMPGRSALHFVTLRKKGKKRQHCICLDKPTFISPNSQLQAIAKKGLHLNSYHIQIMLTKN